MAVQSGVVIGFVINAAQGRSALNGMLREIAPRRFASPGKIVIVDGEIVSAWSVNQMEVVDPVDVKIQIRMEFMTFVTPVQPTQLINVPVREFVMMGKIMMGMDQLMGLILIVILVAQPEEAVMLTIPVRLDMNV